MSRPIKFNITKEELNKLCQTYTLEGVAKKLGFSRSTICVKRREFGLIKKKASK